MDQAGVELLRATDRRQLMQTVWIYEHPVDFDELQRFHGDIGYGLLGRLIERSAVPFGRDRWVSSLGPQVAPRFAEHPRPRAELVDWADECAALPIDPEHGPGWHLSVLPLTDGATAITVVLSHYVVDGIGAVFGCIDAVNGVRRDLGYPERWPRNRFRSILGDLRGVMRDAPAIGRAIVATARLARKQRFEAAPPRDVSRFESPGDRAVDDDPVTVPSTWLFVELADWDERAESLNGNSYALLAALAAKLGERLGRRRPDGTVSLNIALSDRTGLDDTRAIALSFAQANIDPATVTTDLADVRVSIRQAVKEAREGTDQRLELLPLAPLLPRRVLRCAQDVLLGSADLPVAYSNLGAIPPLVACIDGTDAEYFGMRGVDQNVRRADIERSGGLLVLTGGSLSGKFSVGIVAYQAGAENSNARLRHLAAQTLGELGLAGEIY